MKNNESVSVIIPAYNEEHYIERAVKDIRDFLIENFETFEIIIVDDGSSDKTGAIAKGLSKEIQTLKVLKNEKNCGKGYSVKRGMLSATSEYAAFIDADLSTPIAELSKFLPYLTGGMDIAIGSRASKDSNVLKRQSFLREKMGRIFNLCVQALLFKGIKDTQCGFKCFKMRRARKVFELQALRGFCFDAEVLYIAKKRLLKIKELPVVWRNRKETRVRIIRSSFEMFCDIFRIRLNDIRGYYANK